MIALALTSEVIPPGEFYDYADGVLSPKLPQLPGVTSIACILLVGMVMKNAIMMVDFAVDAQRTRRSNALDAIREAARLRIRPITMTMLAAMLSAVPIAVGTGPGFELRQPLGIAIVGGLIVAQLFTLYTTPAIYVIMDKLQHMIRRQHREKLRATTMHDRSSNLDQELST